MRSAETPSRIRASRGKRRDVAAVENHPSAIGDLIAGDDSQRGCLARSRSANQREQLAGCDLQRDIVNSRMLAEASRDPSSASAPALTACARDS